MQWVIFNDMAPIVSVLYSFWDVHFVVVFSRLQCYDKISYLCVKFIVQVVFKEYDGQYTRSSFEFVKCKLTLFF